MIIILILYFCSNLRLINDMSLAVQFLPRPEDLRYAVVASSGNMHTDSLIVLYYFYDSTYNYGKINCQHRLFCIFNCN